MENDLAQKAISLALSGNWEEALKINQLIINRSPGDLDALNRIARCYCETGNIAEAIRATQKVLSLDPANTIAQKCLIKWNSARPSKSKGIDTNSADLFLEESGKTKIISLLNLGSPNIFSSLYCGQEVKLSAYAHKVSVTDVDGKYIGRLPDDIAARLRNLLKNGSKYIVLVKSVSEHGVSVFIRETENKSGITSFPPEKLDYVTFTPPELVHKETPVVAVIDEAMDV